jgi:hypothetical protein
MISTVLSNIIGFIMLIIITMCFFKSTRKLLLTLLKYIWSKIELREIVINLVKRFLAEFKTAKNLMDRENKNERYMYLACTIISFTILVYNYKFNYILFLSFFTYFIFKALTKEVREYFIKLKHEKMSNKYKDLSKIFDNKVKVIAFDKNNGIFKLNSFVPITDIEKKSAHIEHWINKEIESIKRDPKNFRLIYIKTKFAESKKYKKSAKFNDFYMLSDYIKTIEINKKYNLPAMFGVDKNGNNIVVDMMDMYHTFISGETSGGKSTLLNTIIQSMQYFCNNVMFIMVDFKLVGLGIYRNFKNCIFVKSDTEFREKLEWLQNEMMKRYETFLENEVMDIFEYHKIGKKMNYIVLVIDEISNIKLSGNNKKNKNDEQTIDIEDTIANLLNMARAAGIILIACTQNPYGVELKTNIRNKFITNISGRIIRPEVQKMTGVTGTEHLQRGEFKMKSTNINELEFKAYFQNRLNNYVFNELKNMYGYGGVNLEKNIVDIEEFKNKS